MTTTNGAKEGEMVVVVGLPGEWRLDTITLRGKAYISRPGDRRVVDVSRVAPSKVEVAS